MHACAVRWRGKGDPAMVFMYAGHRLVGDDGNLNKGMQLEGMFCLVLFVSMYLLCSRLVGSRKRLVGLVSTKKLLHVIVNTLRTGCTCTHVGTAEPHVLVEVSGCW